MLVSVSMHSVGLKTHYGTSPTPLHGDKTRSPVGSILSILTKVVILRGQVSRC